MDSTALMWSDNHKGIKISFHLVERDVDLVGTDKNLSPITRRKKIRHGVPPTNRTTPRHVLFGERQDQRKNMLVRPQGPATVSKKDGRTAASSPAPASKSKGWGVVDRQKQGAQNGKHCPHRAMERPTGEGSVQLTTGEAVDEVLQPPRNFRTACHSLRARYPPPPTPKTQDWHNGSRHT